MHVAIRVAFAATLSAAASAWTPCAAAGLPGDLRLEPVASGFSNPVALRHAGDARRFVVEQGGRIRLIGGGVPQASAFLDFAANPPPLGFTSNGERGLLGLAFAPDFAGSRRFYVYYTDGNGDSVVARYRVDAGNADRADPASAEVVLRVDQDFANHNGGDLHFGPDGFLYIGLGDGGSGNDPCSRGQTLAIGALSAADAANSGCPADPAFTGSGGNADSRALLGKLLRIDVSTTGAGGERCGLAAGSAGYAIPAGNPYAGGDGVCDEVWAAGLRNPYRFSFDRARGDLLIADVGQGAREEVNAVAGDAAGLNFGWRCREGDIATPGIGCPSPAVFTEPVLAYDRDVGGSITGGFRYRGPQGGLQGVYLFGDFVSGRLFAARPHAGAWRYATWRDAGGNPSGFGEDAAGEVYVLDYFGGTVSRIVTDVLFADSFEADE